MKLGITSIQRNRAPWISEWVLFHYLMGFTKFYIFLHKCSDDSEKILNRLKEKIDIEVFLVDPNLDNPQLKCYQQSYEKFGYEVDWMAFLDGDEFLFSPSHETFLEAFEKFIKKTNMPQISALGVYWSCFGSSRHISEPSGLIIQNYKYRAKTNYENNRHIKSVVKGGLGKAVSAQSPHLFETPTGTYDENLRLIEKGWTDHNPTYKKFRINHYVTQSREFFLNFKSQVNPPDGASKRDEGFWVEHDKNEVLDHSMERFIVPLENLLKN